MTVLQRLERLPMSRPRWRLLFQGGLGYTFDGMDAAGVPSAFGRVGGILAPIAIGVTYGAIGFGGVFVMTTAVLAAGVLAVVIFGLPTASRTLEDTSAEELGTRA